MINFNQSMKAVSNVLSDNGPAILTAFGAVGVVTTAVLAGKASFKAAEVIREAKLEKADVLTKSDETILGPIELTKSEAVKLVWPLYIGAVSAGVLSCGAIVMSHRISSRRAAVLAAAYALNQDKLEEYQDKIKEKFGVKKEGEARAELTQKRVDRDFAPSEVLLDPNGNKVLVREDYTGRFFWSTIETVNRAVNEINHEINMNGSARMSDFYDLLGLSHVSTSDYFGWTHEDRLELEWNTCTTPDGTIPVHSFEYVNHPVMNPGREATFR